MAKADRRSEAIWVVAEKRWTIRVQKDGARRAFHSSTPGRRGKHEAEALADNWLETQSKDARLEAAWAEFLAYQKEHNGTANYMQHEHLGRIYILPAVGNRKLSDITPIMWQRAVTAAAAAGLSRRSCLNVKLTISAFISYARRARLSVDRLERGDIAIPQSAPVGERKILQPVSLNRLFLTDTVTIYKRAVPAFFIHAWRFIVLTGLRRGELCGLRNEDIENGILHIRRSFNAQAEETAGKNANARRYVALPSAALAVLAAQRSMLKGRGIISPWVFPDEHGEQLNSNHLYSMWATYRDQNGFDCSLHELRHTFISIVKNDMPMALLKATVGHSKDMDTLGTYGHEVSGEMHRAAEIVDGVFTRILPPQSK